MRTSTVSSPVSLAEQQQEVQRAAAFNTAQRRFATAEAAYDASKISYASVKAEYDAASGRAALVHRLAEKATRDAEISGRALAGIVRAFAQQSSGMATVDALLSERAGDDMLYQLATLDKLSQLTGNLESIRGRSQAEQNRADALQAEDAAAGERADDSALADAQSEMDSSKTAFDAAFATFETVKTLAATPIFAAGVTALTPLLSPAAADRGQLSSQGWSDPAIGRITDGFGPRPNRPLPDVGAVHHGTDIGAACGAGVYAATAGVVVDARPVGTYGNWILINHGNGIQTGYAHIADGATLVSVGEAVLGGQVIAGVGSTGASTGCHLHFEVRINGVPVDPQPFMAERGVGLGER
ncbi:MAG: Peptidase, family [Cryobacterium sp.]|nr:Peptidase, family [Cryobacterium sp.]